MEPYLSLFILSGLLSCIIRLFNLILIGVSITIDERALKETYVIHFDVRKDVDVINVTLESCISLLVH